MRVFSEVVSSVILDMPLTIEEYQELNPAQRKAIRKPDLQALLDEQINTDGNVNSIRGIIREELNIKFDTLKKDLADTYKTKFDSIAEEQTKIVNEITIMKNILAEHQTSIENQRRENTKNNMFISGIPNEITDNEGRTINNSSSSHHSQPMCNERKLSNSKEL